MAFAKQSGNRPVAAVRSALKPPAAIRPLGGPKGLSYRAFMTGTVTNGAQTGPAKIPPKSRRRILPKKKPVVQLGSAQQGPAATGFRPRLGRGGLH